MSTKHYKAHWGTSLVVLSSVVTALCLTIAFFAIRNGGDSVWLGGALVEPNAMRGSIRTFGNGGFFSFSGLYRNTLLGPYRPFVTDFRHTVILRYHDRTIVVSPPEPEEFSNALDSAR